MVGQRAIHRGTADAKPACNLRRTQLLLDTKTLHFSGVDRWLTSTVDATRLCGSNAFQLTLTPEVGFKFRENAQHVQESFTCRTACVDRLLCRLEGDPLLLQRVHDALKIFDATRKASIRVTSSVSPDRRKSSRT